MSTTTKQLQEHERRYKNFKAALAQLVEEHLEATALDQATDAAKDRAWKIIDEHAWPLWLEMGR